MTFYVIWTEGWINHIIQMFFDFTTDAGSLAYLNGKSFRVENVDFVEEYFPGTKV